MHKKIGWQLGFWSSITLGVLLNIATLGVALHEWTGCFYRKDFTINPSKIIKKTGLAVYFHVNDRHDFTNRDLWRVRVYEDGKRIDMHAKSKQRVVEDGWGKVHAHDRVIWFSASDGTDPRKNKHKYVLNIPMHIKYVWQVGLPIAVFLYWLGVFIWPPARKKLAGFITKFKSATRRGGGYLWRRPLWAAQVTYCLVLVVMLPLGMVERWQHDAMPVVDGDIWGYLEPALSFFENGEISVAGNRPFLYPLLVGIVLRIGDSFAAISIAQQGLNLIVAGVMGWFFILIGSAATRRSFGSYIGLLAGVVFFWLYVFSPQAIRYERFVRPESVSIATMGLCWVLAGWFMLRSLAGRRAYLSLVFLCVLNVAIYFLKQNWSFAMAVVPLLVFLSVGWNRPGAKKYLLLGFLVTGICLGGFLFYSRYLSEKYDRASMKLFMPQYLFSWHAPMMLKGIDDLLADEATDGGRREAMVALKKYTQEKIAASQREPIKVYRRLGFVPDLILFSQNGEGGLFKLDSVMPTNLDDHAQLYWDIIRRALLLQPWQYLSKVVSQLGWYYGFGGQVYHLGFNQPYVLNQTSLECILRENHRTAANAHLFLAYESYLNRPKSALRNAHPSRTVMKFFRFLDSIYIPMVLCFAVFSVWRLHQIFWKKQKIFEFHADSLWLFTALTLLMVFAVNLSFAILSCLSIDRFITYTLSLGLAAQICIFMLAFILGGELLRSKESKTKKIDL